MAVELCEMSLQQTKELLRLTDANPAEYLLPAVHR